MFRHLDYLLSFFPQWQLTFFETIVVVTLTYFIMGITGFLLSIFFTSKTLEKLMVFFLPSATLFAIGYYLAFKRYKNYPPRFLERFCCKPEVMMQFVWLGFIAWLNCLAYINYWPLTIVTALILAATAGCVIFGKELRFARKRNKATEEPMTINIEMETEAEVVA